MSQVPERRERCFLFVCGPVGCGNTFLFRCLTEDPRTYGIAEGDLGGLLQRLLDSSSTANRCPHAVEAFARFMHDLAGDRESLIDKTPSNVRHQEALRRHLPGSRFLFTVREPRAAIASALRGRSIVKEVEHVARLWRSDCDLIAAGTPQDLTVIYEDFIAQPAAVFDRIQEGTMPVASEVYRFAERMARTDRADPRQWRKRVDARTADEIEHWVDHLGLDDYYRSFRAGPGGEADAAVGTRGSRAATAAQLWQRTRSQFYRVYYRAMR